jgi:hypothetical protein
MEHARCPPRLLGAARAPAQQLAALRPPLHSTLRASCARPRPAASQTRPPPSPPLPLPLPQPLTSCPCPRPSRPPAPPPRSRPPSRPPGGGAVGGSERVIMRACGWAGRVGVRATTRRARGALQRGSRALGGRRAWAAEAGGPAPPAAHLPDELVALGQQLGALDPVACGRWAGGQAGGRRQGPPAGRLRQVRASPPQLGCWWRWFRAPDSPAARQRRALGLRQGSCPTLWR